MTIIEILILGIVQGLTEFIPVSSSGHLVILEKLLRSEETLGLAFDVALHAGTLLALVIYFWEDLRTLALNAVRRKESRLLGQLAIATAPAVIVGVVLETYVATTLRALLIVGFSLAGVGLIMFYAEYLYDKSHRRYKFESLTWRQAMLIGAAQALAIIPGVSRSGSTITMGLFAGLERKAALRFSFLLAIPIVAGAAVKTFSNKAVLSAAADQAGLFLLGIAVACVSGMAAIKFMVSYLNKRSLRIFAWYRIALGLVVIFIALN